MYSLQTMLLIGGALVAVGIALGLIIGRVWAPPSHHRELERKLAETQAELATYQSSVAEHFAETSKKVSELTQTYRELHEHLARGALELTSAEIGRDLLQAGERPPELAQMDPDRLEPPRDWAPKVPGSAGMLSEEFGLRDNEPAVPPHPGRV